MKFSVNAPDGTVYAVEAPDQASAIAMAQAQHAPAAIPASLQVDSPADQWGRIGAENMAQAGIRPLTTPRQTAYGAMMATVPFNLGDELAAAANATGDTIANGGSFGNNYDAALSGVRDAQSRFSTEHPAASFLLSLPANAIASLALGPARTLAGTAAQGAGLGGLAGFGSGEGGFANRAGSAGAGAAAGAGTAAAFGAAGRVLQQPNVNPNAQLLLNEGVPLTAGQIAGGVAKKTEDIATSIPVMGDAIAARQSDSPDGLNRAVANRALAPIGQTLPGDVAAGRDTVAFVRGAMSNAYQSALGRLSADTSDPAFGADLQAAMNNAARKLPDDQLRQFTQIVRSEIAGKAARNGGILDGDTIKGIESELTDNIKGFGKGSWNDQKLAASLTDVKTAFRDMLTRQNPDGIADLQNADRAYANYAILRQAGSASGNDLGVFSPAQLANAVRGADASAGKGNYASGTALMQDLSDAAKNVLPNKYPDSGTARRLMQAGVLGAGGPAAYMTGTAIPAAAGIAAGTAAWSQPGQALLRALLAGQRPGALAATGGAINAAGVPASLLTSVLLSQATAK